MRAREFLSESIERLKGHLKDLIDRTSDETLLNKIYTSLNRGSLVPRISAGLESLSDPEIRGFVNEIADIIVQAPGSYEEKIDFVNGLQKGFIDVGMMTDKGRHHFSDLLRPTDKVSKRFLFNMFNALKDLGKGSQKGPGEFAIAIMSPEVSIFGSGDLKIKDKTVEVKAGSGTVGATGLFQYLDVPNILKKYLPDLDVTQNIGAGTLAKALQDEVSKPNTALTPDNLQNFANELVEYIFKGQIAWANVQPLKDAIMNVNMPPNLLDDAIRKGYLIAAYSAYRGEMGSEGSRNKFDGLMLIDYERQDLRYFDDPEELYKDIDKPQILFSAKNSQWAARLISPSVKLKGRELVKPERPAEITPDSLNQYSKDLASHFVSIAQRSDPQNLDLREPQLVTDLSSTLMDLLNQGYKEAKLRAEILKRFPMLNPRAKPNTTNVAQPAPQQSFEPQPTIPSV